jgi:hypothetical protein
MTTIFGWTGCNERDDPGLARRLRLTSSVALLGAGEDEAGVDLQGLAAA